MEIRFQNSPQETKQMDTEQLRKNFLVQNLMQDDTVKLVYSHYDRVIIGGAKPVNKTVVLPNHPELRAGYFLERRELGIINVGAAGIVIADGKEFAVNKLDCVYLGKETKEVKFKSTNKKEPALFYLLSAPAHHKYPNKLMTKEKASPVNLGEVATANKRTIYKYIHLDGIKSCQLVMGLTVLENGSVWNSVPPHTHTRRMEVYFYFDVPAEHRVFHFMGQPQETRHIVTANNEAVISAPWSMHYGCGTSNYGFIWGMAGENQVFTDMDPAPIATLK
ncbi:MAG: 5-dehydro-4-deoxy-D-glucuronate isomerase [Chitinophagaceae bacterium]|jgi:4-deoxy-L-threo-5-hexosulose-uronate ketol-isomerase|nr:5-dehydro-4-deoxy-D-glucuronate isomerase [Chitinophagaceae bacterium]MBK8300989.1 5-dehydro-4-deoxy-D-glucuronate isomerase [Chitinophagaceae bacterium]MBK9660321.1 5-dehydro-4-deoxy-D-glucuronate isomerase [Chitinophagaceae bacterium]MBL0070026.1 5-dehydro-4-deoxy-D-glucuronate isomerase [Chitinophagaceae bacterium]